MDDLDEQQHRELKRALEALKGELERALAVNKESTKPVDLDQPIGRLSRMDAIQQQHMASASRRQMAQRLRLVGQALAMFANEEYGLCRNCEEPIGYRRLRAKPESPRCLECQKAA